MLNVPIGLDMFCRVERLLEMGNREVKAIKIHFLVYKRDRDLNQIVIRRLYSFLKLRMSYKTVTADSINFNILILYLVENKHPSIFAIELIICITT